MLRLVAPFLLLAAACPAPVYDDRIGKEGVPRDPGSLAGTFAIKTVALDLIDSPLGKLESGGTTVYLVARTYDGTDYAMTMTPCSVINLESGGLLITTSDDVVRAIPPFIVPLHVDHATGDYEMELGIELWGLHEDGPAPESADDPNVYDMDDDGKVGVTSVASGLLNGEVYFVQKKTLTLSGITTEDGAIGLAEVVKRTTTLDATIEELKSQAERSPYPDPKESWFAEVPLPDGATCDDVVTARDDETLPRLRPF